METTAIDYANELSSLKELHEDNLSRNFTDEEFNEIFARAEKLYPELFNYAQKFEKVVSILLVKLHEATMEWESE